MGIKAISTHSTHTDQLLNFLKNANELVDKTK